MIHTPVLLQEVLHYLAPQPNENFIDATFGFGGHSFEILKRNGPRGKVLGLDVDAESLAQARQFKKDECVQYGERLQLVNANFNNLAEVAKQENFSPVNGILMDLGMSSWQIEQSGRGFSFLRDEPLNLAMGSNSDLTAAIILNQWSEQAVKTILRDFGEERFAGLIARRLIEARRQSPLNTTFDLVDIIKQAVPQRFQHQRIHPATRTFQALRIAVNDELANLKHGLESGLEILAPGGRLAVISFHSLEDRIVKHFFREQKQLGKLNILTKKPVIPTEDEISVNNRSRSAKLRAIAKL